MRVGDKGKGDAEWEIITRMRVIEIEKKNNGKYEIIA